MAARYTTYKSVNIAGQQVRNNVVYLFNRKRRSMAEQNEFQICTSCKTLMDANTHVVIIEKLKDYYQRARAVATPFLCDSCASVQRVIERAKKH